VDTLVHQRAGDALTKGFGGIPPEADAARKGVEMALTKEPQVEQKISAPDFDLESIAFVGHDC
jgi:hypothetical protein